jgi:hypothetical protein
MSDIFCLDNPNFQTIEIEPSILYERLVSQEPEEWLECKYCQHTITHKKNILYISGSFLHTFKNPAGIFFQIGCFSKAPGCKEIGLPTSDFTWFPDYEWSICVCANCTQHLGWFYQKVESSFYGLVLDRLSSNR